MQMLSNVAITRLAKDQSRFYKLPVTALVLPCIKGRKFCCFVVAGNPTRTQYLAVSRINPQYLGAEMLNFEKPNLTENHQQVPSNDQQAPSVNAPDACAQKKVTSQRRIETNRRNALLSTGPGNTQRTRHNALKHGLLAEGLTRWDDAEEFQENIYALKAIYPSSDPLDRFLIEQMAMEMLRSRRTARFEAETITALSSRPDTSSDPTSDRCTPMIDPLVMKEYAGPALDSLQRYASATLNNLLRCRRELEPIRRDEPGPGSTDTDIVNADVVTI